MNNKSTSKPYHARIATFALITAACSGQPSATPARTDADIARSLVGSWKVDDISPNRTTTEKGSIRLMKDGTLTTEATIVRGSSHISFNFQATWQVKNGVLIETITKTSETNFLHVGYVTRDRILSVDNRELVYKTEKGSVVSRERIP